MAEATEAIHDFLVSRGFKRSPNSEMRYSYQGEIKAAGKDIKIELSFSDLEFLQPPKIKLLNREDDLPNAFAHIDDAGGLCYLQAETIVLDRYTPEGTILACLKQAEKVIEDISRNPQAESLEREVVQLWRGLPSFMILDGNFSGACKLLLSAKNINEKYFWLGDAQQLKDNLPAMPLENFLGAYVLKTDKNIYVDSAHKHPENFSDFVSWAEQFVPLSKTLASIIGNEYPNPPILFVNAPNGCVGVIPELPSDIKNSLQRPKGLLHFLVKQGSRIPVMRISCMPANWDHIIGRNLHGHNNFAGKSIVLIGCGTIGSHLTKFLVQSGAGHGDNGKLLLVDEQNLAPGNIGRHLLGPQDIGRNKALACTEEMKRLYPAASIYSSKKNALKILKDISHYDLIIDATGEESFSISLNHHAFEIRKGGDNYPPILHSYLLGDGDAAQTLFVDGRKEYACYKCSKPDPRGDRKQSPLQQKTQTHHVMAPCGESPYIAYGVGAPVIAASLALQAALSWVDGDPSPRLRSRRIVLETTKDVKDKNWEGADDCPACKDKRK